MQSAAVTKLLVDNVEQKVKRTVRRQLTKYIQTVLPMEQPPAAAAAVPEAVTKRLKRLRKMGRRNTYDIDDLFYRMKRLRARVMKLERQLSGVMVADEDECDCDLQREAEEEEDLKTIHITDQSYMIQCNDVDDLDEDTKVVYLSQTEEQPLQVEFLSQSDPETEPDTDESSTDDAVDAAAVGVMFVGGVGPIEVFEPAAAAAVGPVGEVKSTGGAAAPSNLVGPTETEAEPEEEEELVEIMIDDMAYCTNNEDSGVIYAMTADGDVGEKVGYFKKGEPFFYVDDE